MTKRNAVLSALAVFSLSGPLHAVPLGTAFTYQGTLAQNGVDVTDTCDFNFGLWDASAGGSEVAMAVDVPNVSVVDGKFTVELDFGGGVFHGNARWLEIAVACPAGGGLTTLVPRQELTPSPSALYAASAAAAGGNTLDQAYDQGGAGAGRTITADSGAVTIQGADGLELDAANLLQTPANPVVVGGVQISSGLRNVYVSGRYAYIPAFNSLYVVDVTDPGAPSITGHVNVGTGPRSVMVSGRFAYMVSDAQDDLIMVDVSDPSDPVEVGRLEVGNAPASVFVSGRYAYVANGIEGEIVIIDITDPTAPSEAARLNTGATNPSGIYVSGGYALIIDVTSDDLKVVDVSNPIMPSLVGDLSIGPAPTSIYVSGRYAYVVDGGSDDLKVIDISDPFAPMIAGSLGIGGSPTSIHVSGRYAYIVDFDSTDLRVVDVSDPAAPTLVGTLDIGNSMRSVFVSGRYAYVTDFDSNQLKIFDVSGAEVSSLMAHSLEAGNLQVRNDLIAQGQIQVTGGVNVGSGGIFSDGDVGIAGAISAFGQALGVHAETDSVDGIGVHGVAPETGAGASRGVLGEASSDDGIGVYGLSDVHVGVFGQTDAAVGATLGSPFPDTQVAGVYGNASVDTPTEVIHGVVGETRSSVGGGVYATNRSSTSSFSPDLVLGISDYGDGGDNGVISSEPSDNNSDIFLMAMDTVVVRLNEDGSGDSQSLNSRFEVAYTPSGGSASRIFYVSHLGNVYADGSYNCGNAINDAAGDLDEGELAPCLVDDSSADFAEMLPSSGSAQPGDVLVAGPDGSLTRSWNAYSGNVVGVYSTRPSYLGNARFLDEKDHVPLAVSGIVPVRASAENGAIQAGDLLTSAAMPGHAMRCEGLERCFGRVIGKALEPLSEGTGQIRILVSLN